MSLALHVVLPPVLLTLVVLWVAGGFWCEKNILHRDDSLIASAIAFVAFMIWALIMIGGLLLLGGSVVALFFRLFVQ